MDAAIERFVLDLLADHDVMTLATVREDGYPQATTVAYVNDRLVLYFGCGGDSQKVHNIRRCDKVSLTIDRDYPNWNDIRGLSMGARAAVVTDPEERRRVGELMMRKFPVIAEFASADDMQTMAVVRVTPEVISVLDYSKGFGHTDLVTP
ncbi:MAG: pyridoxamine 5'-phosphate oxidase family protein [Gammaproteobacteria bacterium]